MKLILPTNTTGSKRIPRRRGFTLLELLLASVCAVMLLSALYFSFDMTIEQTQTARDQAGTEDLSRGVINRLAIDINAVLGPQPALSGGTAGMLVPTELESTLSGGTATSGATTGNTAGGSAVKGNVVMGNVVGGNVVAGKAVGGMSGGGGGSSSSSSSSSTPTPLLGSGMFIPLQTGVIGGYEGNMNMMVLFTSRVPDIFSSNGPNSLAQLYNGGGASSNNNVQVPADLRRVVYWLGSNGGLYRHETPWVMGTNNYNLSDLPLQDSAGTPLAEEVKNVVFEYWDSFEQSWETSWDGTGGTSPPYTMVPGPPAAIRITLTFEFSNPKGGKPFNSTIQQVFPIFTAPGQTTMALYNATASAAAPSSSNSSVVGGKVVGGTVTGGSVTGGAMTGGKTVGGTTVNGK
ncbi:MAG TPA: prepilin-type N-terminal cleavage/methylation domain-containing protein [Gemmata sp.]|nr:prepilin-type N-terminal cleavage/methylation domain-containing protein [Gemmata sp.]